MSFLTHLESVVSQVDGALACSIMGYDGISVETHQSPGANGLELNGAWVEFANILSQLKNSTELLKNGTVSEVSVSTEKTVTVMRMVTSEYFLVLTIKADGNYGKGRYVLRITAPKVQAEL